MRWKHWGFYLHLNRCWHRQWLLLGALGAELELHPKQVTAKPNQPVTENTWNSQSDCFVKSRGSCNFCKAPPLPSRKPEPRSIADTAVSCPRCPALIGRRAETRPRCFHQALRSPSRVLLTVSLRSWEYPSVQFWVLVRDNPRWKQYMYIYAGILRQASNSGSSKSSRWLQGAETHFFHQTTWFLDHFSGCKGVRKQPALKDEMPLRRKGKRKQEALSTAQGNPPLPSSPEHQQTFKGAWKGYVRWKKVGNCLSGSGFFLLSTNGTRRQIV